MDLLERLRRAYSIPAVGTNISGIPHTRVSVTAATQWLINPDGPEAAAEITRLRTALEKIANIPSGVFVQYHAREIARAALNPTNER